jgi:zinc transporter, ZIP family
MSQKVENKPQAERPDTRLQDGITALTLFIIVVIASIWVGRSLNNNAANVWLVLVAATITAVTTGFGALPFLFFRNINAHWLGIGNALAAGLMLGASIGLIVEGAMLENIGQPVLRLILGIVLGVVLVFVSHQLLSDRTEEFQIGQVQGADAIQMLMIVGIMTVHSFAEGIGVGVSYGDTSAFGLLISIAIAIHNIPEGLAISLVLIPRGTSVSRAAWWSVFTSLPQPLMAVPAFLFVLAFKPFLPVGLGLAAGAMVWMVFNELLPEALEDMPARTVYPTMIAAVAAMLLFQYLIG